MEVSLYSWSPVDLFRFSRFSTTNFLAWSNPIQLIWRPTVPTVILPPTVSVLWLLSWTTIEGFMVTYNLGCHHSSIAQWICLRLPSCHPRFESQTHHLGFYQFILKLYTLEKTKINIKRGRDWPIKNLQLGWWRRRLETRLHEDPASERTPWSSNHASSEKESWPVLEPDKLLLIRKRG